MMHRMVNLVMHDVVMHDVVHLMVDHVMRLRLHGCFGSRLFGCLGLSHDRRKSERR